MALTVDFTTGNTVTDYTVILRDLPQSAVPKIIGVINYYNTDTQASTFMLYQDTAKSLLRFNKSLTANTKYQLGFVYLIM